MSAMPKTKVFDKLDPFIVGGIVDGTYDEDAPSLEDLDVFHQRFSQIDGLPTAREVNKTYAQGIKEGRELAQQEGAQHLQVITDLVNGLQMHVSNLGKDIQDSHSRTIAGILRSVLPRLAEKSAGEEINHFINQISGQVLNGQIKLKSSLAYTPHLQNIVDKLEASGSDLPGFIIEPDETLMGTAVKANWQSGGAKIDIDGAVTQCLALLAQDT